MFPTPVWIGADALSVHPTGTTKIARCIETGNHRMIYIDWSPEARTVLEIDLGGWNIGVGIKLVIEKAAEKLWKSWLTDMNGKILGYPWITSFWKK
jgi:hypothetical protein